MNPASAGAMASAAAAASARGGAPAARASKTEANTPASHSQHDKSSKTPDGPVFLGVVTVD
jgi:hypothetical protein